MMKKIILLFAAMALLVFSCTKDLKQDIDDLKDRVEALETVASIEFQDSDLLVTYTDGSTSSVTTSEEVVPGNVSGFEVEAATNLITVTFTDGTSRVYRVFTSEDVTYMSAVLSGDYGITTVSMGDVTMANLTYDNQNRMVEAMINLPDGSGNVINVLELHNNYADANPTAMAISKSLYSDIDYSEVEYYSTLYAYFPGDSGYTFYQKDGDMYTYYQNRWWNGVEYRYNSRPHCWFVADDDIDYDSGDNYYPVAGEDSLFYQSYSNYNYMSIDDVYGRLYIPSRIIRITDVYAAGETMDTSMVRLTMRDDGLIEKIENLDGEGEEVRDYFELNYDSNDLLTSMDLYEVRRPLKKKSASIDEDDEHYMSIIMTYTEGLLTSLRSEFYDEDGSVEETTEIGEIVYDDAGNPVEIWSSLVDYGSNDENFIVDENGKIIYNPQTNDEIMKIIEIEYDYTMPNFFGKSLEYLVPELKGLKITSAPSRILRSGSFDFADMVYSDFNEGGYPANVRLETNILGNIGLRKSVSESIGSGVPTSFELDLEYTLFE